MRRCVPNTALNFVLFVKSQGELGFRVSWAFGLGDGLRAGKRRCGLPVMSFPVRFVPVGNLLKVGVGRPSLRQVES